MKLRVAAATVIVVLITCSSARCSIFFTLDRRRVLPREELLLKIGEKFVVSLTSIEALELLIQIDRIIHLHRLLVWAGTHRRGQLLL